MAKVMRRGPTEREIAAQMLYERLSPAMSALGIIFLLVVLAQALVPDDSPVRGFLVAAGWLIWASFVIEFVARMVIAPSTTGFLRKNWWQLLFLVIPFLSFVRALLIFRLARPARVLLAAVRGTRSARRRLSGRVGWLSAATVIVILTGGNLLYEFGGFRSYVDALHATAMTAISGESIGGGSPIAKILDVVLAVYSVVFFASLAAMLGAFFLERRAEHVEELKQAGVGGASDGGSESA